MTAATLLHPFTADLLPPPKPDARVLWLGADPDFVLPEAFPSDITFVQGFRPTFLRLAKTGRNVIPSADGDAYDLALVQCTRHRGENEARIGEALRRLKPGGMIVVAGGKTEGADSLRKRVGAWLSLEGHASKHHGIVFWAHRPETLPPEAIRQPEPMAFEANGARFQTLPGMFSHGEVDPASKLLADRLPIGLKGHAADFCAGCGYLSCRLLDAQPRITALDLYEADWASLEAAKSNLSGENRALGFFWQDLLGEPVERRYDVIVMNPPFHQGRAAEPEIGQGMIKAAAKALKSGGRLFMVANRGLPYETALGSQFKSVRPMGADKRFNLFEAVR
ncbi:MAG: class I SAM-dependent methyltransferase [Methylobacterium mesophilicum]|nr:class I SAM-dependent methyltransferase [Methylobacterium mesophilicum]